MLLFGGTDSSLATTAKICSPHPETTLGEKLRSNSVYSGPVSSAMVASSALTLASKLGKCSLKEKL